MFCALCGTKQPANAKFCPSCGKHTATAAPSKIPSYRLDDAPASNVQRPYARESDEAENGSGEVSKAIALGLILLLGPGLIAWFYFKPQSSTEDYAGLVTSLVIAACSIWVYADATRNRIGKLPGRGGLLNLSAGALAGATMLLWIVAFPLYLFKRRALIKDAKASPSSANGVVAFAISGLIFAASSVAFIAAASLPACDDVETLQTANEAISSAPLLKLAGLELGPLQNAAEQDSERGKRICRGFVQNPLGGDMPINYSVSWHNRSKGLIYVEILD